MFTFDAIGTQWKIETHQPLGRRLQERILERIHQFDTTYSRFRPGSLVSRIAAASVGGCFDFPDDSTALFDLYDQLHTATEGAVDPLVGRDLELLGYDRTYSLIPASNCVRAEAHASGKANWSKDIIRDGTSLITQRPLVIDVGAAGKGYLVDIVSEILREAGFTQFVVDGSGDLHHLGESVIQVGLEHPFDPQLVIGVVNLRNSALCASAVTRRAWGDGLHHVLDARTGVPVRDVVATWVVADDAATADGLGTALFFTSADRLAKIFLFSYVRMFADGRAEVSPNFNGEIFSSMHLAVERMPLEQTIQLAKQRADMATLGKRLRATVAVVSAALIMTGCSITDMEIARPTFTPDSMATRSRSESSDASIYVDGIYTATGKYGSLPSSITVTITLVDGIITAIEVTPHATNPTSLDLQRRFAAAIPAVVVGKHIDEVNVGHLAGSSGTPDGFNAAIEQIKEQARIGQTTSK